MSVEQVFTIEEMRQQIRLAKRHDPVVQRALNIAEADELSEEASMVFLAYHLILALGSMREAFTKSLENNAQMPLYQTGCFDPS